MKTDLSDLVRGFAALIEGGKWTMWYDDGRTHSLTPPREMVGDKLTYGQRLTFCVSGGHKVSHQIAAYEYTKLTDIEQRYLHDIFRRVYWEPSAKRAEEAARKRDEDVKIARDKWLDAVKAMASLTKS